MIRDVKRMGKIVPPKEGGWHRIRRIQETSKSNVYEIDVDVMTGSYWTAYIITVDVNGYNGWPVIHATLEAHEWAGHTHDKYLPVFDWESDIAAAKERTQHFTEKHQTVQGWW